MERVLEREVGGGGGEEGGGGTISNLEGWMGLVSL